MDDIEPLHMCLRKIIRIQMHVCTHMYDHMFHMYDHMYDHMLHMYDHMLQHM